MAKRQNKEQIEASLTRWKSRLRRAVTMIDKLEKQLKRINKAKPDLVIADLAVAPPLATKPKPKPVEPPPPTPVSDTSIPSFLRREPDPVAAGIAEDQAEKKRLKARGRIATMKAKKAGDLKKMPLTGKAALDAIRNG